MLQSYSSTASILLLYKLCKTYWQSLASKTKRLYHAHKNMLHKNQHWERKQQITTYFAYATLNLDQY